MQRGFTLVEIAVVLALVAIVTGIALPGYLAHVQRAARADAIEALTRLQAAQERFRAANGLYAERLAVLALPERSTQGRYRIALTRTAGEAYRASASARGAQAQDLQCAELTLDVDAGFARTGPDARCWNR